MGFKPAHDSVSTVTNSYWDTTTTGQSSSDVGTGQTTSALQTPTAYGAATPPPASIYAGWDDVDVDGDGNVGVAADTDDDAWDFGGNNQYPRLKYGGHNPADQLANVTAMTITSSAGPDGQYGAGDVITLRLAFAQDVTVISGAALPLTIGSATRNATPPANSAGRTIDFSYTVLPADMDSDGIAIAAAATLAGAFGRSSVNYALPDTLATAQAAHKVNAVTVSYDSDGDGLIEIRNLAQLNAMRWDLDGDGVIDPEVAATRIGDTLKPAGDAAGYARAFPNRAPALGCPDTAADADTDPGPCLGYELMVNLDFDTNGSGTVDTGDTYCNIHDDGVNPPACSGWRPIGADPQGAANANIHRYNAVFQGNGKVIDNLYVRSGGSDHGLFGALGPDAKVEALALRNANVTGRLYVGVLAGNNFGRIAGAYTTGSVMGASAGGLVGYNQGAIVASYSTASVTLGTSNSFRHAGGLVGWENGGSITASYAAGAVTGSGAGGLVGRSGGSTIANSYWDTQTTTKSSSAGAATGDGKTSSAPAIARRLRNRQRRHLRRLGRCGCGRRRHRRRSQRHR